MRRIPWRLSLRYSRKGAITVVGIALGIAFAFVSISIAQGLERDTLGIARNHPDTAAVVTAPDGEPIPVATLARFPSVIGVAYGEGRGAAGEPVLLVALVGDASPLAPDGSARPVVGTPLQAITLADGATLAAGEPVDHPILPAGAYLVPAAALGAHERVQHGILLDPTAGELDALHADGLETQRAPAMRSFFRATGVEIARDLLLVVAFSSVLAVLFCYEFLRSEVRESRREIGIWRAVGMRSKDVVALFVARAAAIGVISLLVGAAASVLLLGYAYQRTGNETLRFALTPSAAVALPVVFLVASVVGGIVPALLAGRISVQQALETRA